MLAGGVLLGTVGAKALTGKNAKKMYAQCAAAALRAKDGIVKTASVVQENAEDILAEARAINAERAAQDAAYTDFYQDFEDAVTASEAEAEESDD